MAKTYAKLLSSITASTLWSEPNQTRILWITMLAMADRYGRVEGTVPGLAHMARISVEDTRVGLQRFLSPDADSNNQAYEGRRIEKIEGGWKLLSYERIRDMRDEEAHRESARKYAARKREEAKNQQLTEKINIDGSCPSSHLISSQLKSESKETKTIGRQADRFPEFWRVYPTRVKKKTALSIWRLKHLDLLADKIIVDIGVRKDEDYRWKNGFIPDPTTYLRQERWNDEISQPPEKQS